MINSIVATGRIGKNPPNLKETTKDDGTTKSVCWFSFGITQHGKYANQPIWISCNAHGNQARKLSEWCGRGDTLTIQGKLMEGKGKDGSKYHFLWVDEFSPHLNMNEENQKALDAEDPIF